MKRRKKNVVKQADELFAQLILARNKCELAPYWEHTCKGVLQPMHICSRRYYPIRWSEENAVAGCQGAHFFFSLRPIEWDNIIEEMFPGRLQDLKRRALEPHKTSYPALLASLQSAFDKAQAQGSLL